MSRRGLALSVLAAASLLLGWKTYRAWTEPPAAGVLPTAARPAQESSATAGYVPADADLSAAAATIAARPVFRPDRKPFRPEEAAAGPPARNHQAELARYLLLGVVLQADTRKAVVVTKGQAKVERWELDVGDSIPGFTVKEIETDGVTLSADGKEFLLPLFAGGPKAPAPGPARTDAAPAARVAPAPGQPATGVPHPAPRPQQVMRPPGAVGR